jgi:hypothetical protein
VKKAPVAAHPRAASAPKPHAPAKKTQLSGKKLADIKQKVVAATLAKLKAKKAKAQKGTNL